MKLGKIGTLAFKRMLYAVLDAAGEVLTVEKRVRLKG